MLDSSHLKKLHKDFHDYAKVRRDVIKVSGDALHHAKRAIFAMHRGNMKEAKQKIAESEKLLKQLNKKHKNHAAMKVEGSYKAGVEEFVEASLFYQFLSKGKIGKVSAIPVNGEVYLAGLCDVPGELYRYAIRAASNKDVKTVEKCELAASEIIGELIEFDLTKYLRTKFDQAKNAHQKLEIVLYELSLRG